MVATVASAQAAPASTVVIKVKSVSTSGVLHDRPPKGLSKGDVYAGRDNLTNVVPQFGKPVGAVVGSDQSTLTLTSATTGRVTGIARFPGGTVTFSGQGKLGANARLSVVGGTGRYAGARGTLITGSGDSPLNTYRLALP